MARLSPGISPTKAVSSSRSRQLRGICRFDQRACRSRETDTMTRLAEPIIVAQWWKKSVRVTLTTYADRNLVDLRTWFTADGKLQPGKGFAADVRHLPRLAAALAKAVAKATELGLLPANNNGAEPAQRPLRPANACPT